MKKDVVQRKNKIVPEYYYFEISTSCRYELLQNNKLEISHLKQKKTSNGLKNSVDSEKTCKKDGIFFCLECDILRFNKWFNQLLHVRHFLYKHITIET